MCRRRKDRERRIGGGREEEERKKQTVRREIKETDNMNEYIISFLDLFLQCIYHFQYNITVVLVPGPKTNSRSTAIQHHTHIITVMQRLQLRISSPP